MKHPLFKGLYHFTVYAVGILVLLAAVLVTLVRLFLPDIGIYRNEVEAWVSKYSGYPIVIHSIKASWQGWTPELTLTNIDLLNKAGTEEITHFDKARIQIAPLATLVERQFIPKSLVISGFELSITRHVNGAISIQDIELENIKKKQSDNELAEWLFKQDEIEIQNAQIEWIDRKYKQDEPILLTNVSFRMRNDVGRIQIDGSTNLPESYGKTMDFAFDAFGNLLTSDWSGELYLSANDINPDNWYRNIRPVQFNLSGGNANIKVWMNWKQAKLASLQGQLKYNDFEALIQDKHALSLNKIATSFRGERTGEDGWRFNVKLNNFITENGAWPDTDITISREPTSELGKYRYAASFSYLNIGDLAPILSKISFIPDKTKTFLNKMVIGGQLYDTSLRYDQSDTSVNQFSFSTRFDNLKTTPDGKLPSFSGLKGYIQGTPSQGKLVLQESTAEFKMPHSDNKTIDISKMTGNIHWTKTAGSWALQTDRLSVSTRDLTASLTGSVSQQTGAPPFLDLVMNTGEINLEKLSDYLPETPKFRLKDWMEKVFLGGKVTSASALFRGSLKDFPFDHDKGRFQLLADVSDATLKYSKVWPVADQLYGEVEINGRHMRTHIQNGKIYNADITTADVTIADILKKKKTVNISGHMKGNIHDLTQFIDQSPLQHHATLTEIRNAMKSGEFGLDLSLGVPLKQKGKKPDVNGTIGFMHAVMDSPVMKIHVNNINGKVAFTGDSVSSETLKAEYEGGPVGIALTGTKTDPEHPYTITISGQGDDKFVVDRLVQYVPVTKQLENYLRSHISGTTPWQAQLSYIQDKDSNLEKHLLIKSNLKGLQIELPEPAEKRKFSSTPLEISTVLSKQRQQEIRVSYNSNISCILQLDKQAEKKLQQVHLYIGRRQNPPDSTGKFIISGKIDNLNVKNWITFLNAISTGEENTHPVLNDIDMDLDIAHLDLFSHDYFDVNTLGRKNEWGWSFNLDSKNIKGDVYFPDTRPGQQRQLTLLLNKLAINESNGQNRGLDSFDPSKLPLLSVAVNNFEYFGRDMGALDLKTSNMYNGVAIDEFEFKKPSLIIKGNGTWLADGNEEQSKFKIDLHAHDMRSMFKTFGYNLNSIKDGETKFQIVADWKGSPMDFSLKNLNGRLEMEIKNGQLLDINPSAGRLFGLLSFQTLPRRLTLDFRDLFSKGLSFDKIEGKFDISNGNAYTNNLFMDSPAADVSITGRTGLAEHDYDQIVTVTPQVSESMPVAGAFFGPVGIGVGAMIYLMGEMFNSLNTNIDNLLKYQYTITGSWENPIIEKIKQDEVVAGG